jgi:class 3 adenylate cyclase/tetratricopeptide (TPR) repeat protein/energy-coupling factor transporter ATP-binding protein EcfA2
MDVGAWLRGLGLEQYAPAFRDNDVDGEVLPELTSDDLISIGVTSVGHRRKLLAAIAALGTPPPTVAYSVASASAAPTSPATIEAERRQLTVMFCDLVGSTPLSVRFDPEDLREVIGAYHRCVADTVARFAGFVAKYMGDGVLIYFGYPEAHEEDAERAVRAGLAVIDAVGGLATTERLNVRLGIASGLVVVGDLIGAGAAQERGVVGETPNLAARLQALAQPGTLVIAESTRRQIGGLFEIEDLGPHPLAGFAEPQRAWRVVGESDVLSRFEALRSGAMPLVGRDEELALLLRRWQQAKAGEGRVVLVSGEPGIGKSRLTAALSQALQSESHTRLRYFCSPYHQDSALHPFIVQLERAAGLARDDTADQKLEKLRELLAPGARGDDETELLAELLSLPSAADDLNLSPQRKHEMLLEALLHQFEALARSRPVLMVFEDAHWIDPTSRELLDLTIDRAARLPVLLIVTFRPEFQHAWGGQSHVTMLALNRLGGHDGAALVERLAGNAGLPRETVDEIVERADGVPLFVEELTKAVLETGEGDNRVAAVLAASPLPNLAIPATLHASLIARLDRLGPIAKEVGQIGSVIGREFGYDLIEQVAQRSAAELRSGLDRLVEAGLLFCRGVAPQSSYLFKHALVQDAAYGTLLRARRQELHARVAAALERHLADLVERQPELLAHHLAAAGEASRAVAQWLKAGQFAAGRSAHIEAIAHYGHGLALLSSLPDAPDRDRQEISLQLALGLSLGTARGFSSAEVAGAYARARELCEKPGEGAQLFAALWGLWISNQRRGVHEECRGLSKTLLDLTRDSSDHGLRLQAHHSAWTTSFYCGEPLICREHCLEGRHLYDPVEHGSHARVYGGHDSGVCAASMLALSEWLLGYPQKALASSTEALGVARSLGHPFSLYNAHHWAAVCHQFRSEDEASLRHIEAQEALGTEHRFSPMIHPSILRGGVRAADVNADAVVVIRSELAKANVELLRPYGFALLAGALARAGDDQSAIMAAAEGLSVAASTGVRWWEAELYRLRAVSLLARADIDAAQACLEQALLVARRQRAKSLELRAATSLARLWGEQGRRAEARDLLAPVYGWFTEGFDTPDLKDAKTLLDALA